MPTDRHPRRKPLRLRAWLRALLAALPFAACSDPPPPAWTTLGPDGLPASERAAVEALLGDLDPATVELLRLAADLAPIDLPYLPGPGNGNRISLQNGHVVQVALDAVADTAPLTTLPRLVDVVLDGPFDELRLQNLAELRAVTVHAVREPDRPVHYEFADLPRLEQLISNGRPIREVTCRGPFPALGELSLVNSDLSAAPELDAPNLHTLNLHSNPITDLASLARFPRLERLQLGNAGIESVAGLPTLPELLSLGLDGNPLTEVDADLDARLPRLRRLGLRRTAVVTPPRLGPEVRGDLDENREFEAVLARLRQSHTPRDGEELIAGPSRSSGRQVGRSGRCTWKTSTSARARVSCDLTVDQLRGTAAVELGTTDLAMPFKGGGTPIVQVRLSTQEGSARVLVRHAFDVVATARLLVSVGDATAQAAARPGDTFDGYRASAPASPEFPSTVRGEPTLLGDRVVLWVEQVSSEPVEGMRLVVEPVD